MADKIITAPVGRRWRNINVTNLTEDQRTVIELLSAIPTYEGGQKGAWTPPSPGNKGVCPSQLEEAIWGFQVHWKKAGVFTVIDGVVDPAMNTLKKMNELARGAEVGPYGLPWPDLPFPPLRPPKPGPVTRTLLSYVSTTHEGAPHDHADERLCPLVKDIRADAKDRGDGRISHIATPIRPRRVGRMVNIGGAKETQYLGFQDFVPDPSKDPRMPAYAVLGRPLTTTLPDASVSDICFRSVPLDRWMREVEMPRICQIGCRLTFAASSLQTHQKLTATYFRTLGQILQYARVEDHSRGHTTVSHVTVVTMLNHR